MGIFSSKPDYLSPFMNVQDLFESLLIDFYNYNDENKFCSGLVALLDNNVNNGQISEGTIANNERQQELCSTITRYYAIKIETIKTAKLMLEKSKKIVDAIEKGHICSDFFDDDKYMCNNERKYYIILPEHIKNDVIRFFLEYMDKIVRLNDINQLNKLENIDFTKVEIYRDTLLKITDYMLTDLKRYYTEIYQNNGIKALTVIARNNELSSKTQTGAQTL